MDVRQKLTSLKNSDFLKNIGKMMSGTGAAHLLGIAVYPVLTRLYTPEQIGVYATFVSIFMIYAAVATLRYEYATLIPRTQQAANNVTFLSLFVLLVFSSFLMLTLLVLGPALREMLNLQELGRLIYLLPVSVVTYSLFMILTFHFNRIKEYGKIAGAKITAATGIAGGQAGLGFGGFLQSGMVVGKVFGDIAGVVFLLWKRRKIQSSISAGVSPLRMAAMAKRYRNFAFYNTPHALTTTSSNNFPVLLFNSFFSDAIAGFYAMAAKICYSPVQVVAHAAYQVFSQRVAEKYGKRERIIPFIHSNLAMLAGVGFLPFLLLFFISPKLFPWLLGDGWEMTGLFVQILTPFIFLVFVATPMNFIPLMLNRQRKAFVIDFCYLLLRLAALSIGIWYQDVMLALTLYSAVGVCVNLYQLSWFYAIARKAERDMFPA